MLICGSLKDKLIYAKGVGFYWCEFTSDSGVTYISRIEKVISKLQEKKYSEYNKELDWAFYRHNFSIELMTSSLTIKLYDESSKEVKKKLEIGHRNV
jgi:hypothetical protein